MYREISKPIVNQKQSPKSVENIKTGFYLSGFSLKREFSG